MQLKKAPSMLRLDDLNALFIRNFLHYVEHDRKVSARSRNQRLAAIRSCFQYAAFLYPEKSHLIQQVLAIPNKRHERALIHFLTLDEINALLQTPDQRTWTGRRDHALLLLAIHTGLRVSELTHLRLDDVTLGVGTHLRCFGKGRKERATPLTQQTCAVLKAWIPERKAHTENLLFTNARGGRLSTDGVQYILNKHVKNATHRCPSLEKKHVTPHVLRHTAAMQLLHAGVERTVIALWLGHESIETTNVYIEADMKMKEEALKKTTPLETHPLRFQPEDPLLAFLKAL
jgi:site-specific recombinase XerD